ncbi:hypothetical protein K435DRAFT_861618 [Dendrothele bispora CBS 962.96]|uniref:Uncharacterized protein n=1 Tax=Dendrothele bispora (strain CBS 962.96) TaxID=1314807 RepID=A0A4S8LVD3_DENBC|nr:hypothetical protein K435DRAFT_861618 [Dendrothele bispora CBS 962.96]
MSSQNETLPKAEIKLVGNIPKGPSLILASGDAGKYWAKGVKLNEQAGAVMVNNIQVGLVFTPSWTNSTIIISETFTRLPMNYMYDYAKFLLNELKPSSASLLDVYPAPTYISPEPIAIQDAPIRYLSTSSVDSTIESNAQPLSPPNIIHTSTSASLLSLIGFMGLLKGNLFLLPFPRIPAPPPKTLQHSDFSHLSEDEYQWSESFMNTAQKLLFHAVDEEVTEAWHAPKNSHLPTPSSKVSSTVGEGGMYI